MIDEAINLEAPEWAETDVKVRGTTCVDPESGNPVPIESTDPQISSPGTNVVSMLVGSGIADDGGAGATGIAPDSTVWFYGAGDIEEVNQCELQDPTRAEGDVDLARDIELDIRGLPDVNDGAQVLSDSGERVDSVYGQAANAPNEAGENTLWVWIAVGGTSAEKP